MLDTHIQMNKFFTYKFIGISPNSVCFKYAFLVLVKHDTNGLVEKEVSCRARRPRVQIPVGAVLFRICEKLIGGWWDWWVAGWWEGELLEGFCHYFYWKYKKQSRKKAFPAYCDLFLRLVLHSFCRNFFFLRSSMHWPPRMFTEAAMISLKVHYLIV